MRTRSTWSREPGAADLIAATAGVTQLGISRGSPDRQGNRWLAILVSPAEGESDADLGRRHAEVFDDTCCSVMGFAQPNPTTHVPTRRAVAPEPHSDGLRYRIMVGRASKRHGNMGSKNRG